jgi:serine/threonine-protein kinase
VGAVLSDRYVLERLIGQGAMGWVYRATDVALNRAVAIKILLPELSRVPEIYARFAREARSIAGLDHPNVVPVFDVGHTAPWHYFVMKLLEGEPLSQRIHAGVMAVEAAVEIGLQILSGLEHLHGRGLIHRDIKPGNVLLTNDGRAVILDFGILRTASLEPRMTAAGLFHGTPEYVAPEIVRAGPGDARSDLYGLGITMYEMLTGVVPFDGGSPIEIAARRLREAPMPLRGRRPDVPPAVEDVVMRALERDPDERFSSAGAMREALALAATTVEPGRPVPELPRARHAGTAATQVIERPGRRGSSSRSLVALAAAAVLAVAGFALWPRNEPPNRPNVHPVGWGDAPGVAPVPRPPAPPIPSLPPVWTTSRPPVTPAASPGASATPPGHPEPSAEHPVGWSDARGHAAPTVPAAIGKGAAVRRPRTQAPAGPAVGPEVPASTQLPVQGPAASPTPAVPAKGSPLERARAALRAGQNAQALRLFTEASRAAPGSAAPLRGLGDAYLAVGNRTAAMAAYRRYLALDPGARDAAAVRSRLEALGGHRLSPRP